MRVSSAIVAHAQVWLFALALAGFIGLIFILVAGQAHLDSTTEKLVYAILGVYGTIVTQMSGYFYQRQRPDSTGPGETTVTTRTAPPGETTVTTTPADTIDAPQTTTTTRITAKETRRKR